MDEPVTRTCPVCHTPLPAGTRRRYCGPPCKTAGWRREHRDPDRPVITRMAPFPPPPTTIRDCPHCGEPVAIVALLATPTTAHTEIPHTN